MRLLFSFIWMLTTVTVFGQYQVGHTTIDFVDPSRNNRTIQTEIYYPANTAGDDVAVASGTFPVIVFGHGFVMIYSAYENIWTDLVPEGYIMAFPRTEGNFSPSHSEFGTDLAFLVGAMQAEGADNNSLFFGATRPETAIMGHSMGGGATILASESNTSIKTLIGLAPAETNPSAIAAAANVSVPALILSGSEDAVTPPADHHTPIYNALGSNCKTFVSITGGAHCYFANSNFNCDFGEGTSGGNISIDRATQQSIASSYLKPWLAYTLYNDCNGFLEMDSLLNADAATTFVQACNLSIPTTSINVNGSTLEANAGGTAYQWYLNGTPINGATSQTYSPTSSGSYTVVVSYAVGCDGSAEINWTATGINETTSRSISVFPNPASTHISLDLNVIQQQEILRINCYDAMGRKVEGLSHNSQSGFLELDVQGLSKGFYTLIITTKNTNWHSNFIKE